MRHKFRDLKDSRREFIVEVYQEEVAKKLDEIYQYMKDTIEVPGFRKGKVPREILERYHGDVAREKAINEIIQDSYVAVIKETKTKVVGLPHISNIEFKEKLSYKVVVDIRPKIDLKNYKNIKVKKKDINVTDSDIDRYISSLQESYAQFKNVEDRPAKLGDYLICDILCEIDGRPIQQEQKNIWLLLDKDSSIPELVEGLVGVSRGDVRDIKAILPDNIEDAKYSKKEALFKIKVNQIKEKQLPEINDEFVKSLGTYQSVEELKEAARKDLIKKKENYAKKDMIDQIYKYLLDHSNFSAPKGLVDEETEALVEESKEYLRKRGVSEEEIKKREQELRDTLRKDAYERVRLYFLLDEIARFENIDVDDEEIDGVLNLLADQSNMPRGEFKKRYRENDKILSLKNQLKENKVTEFLLKNAEIK